MPGRGRRCRCAMWASVRRRLRASRCSDAIWFIRTCTCGPMAPVPGCRRNRLSGRSPSRVTSRSSPCASTTMEISGSHARLCGRRSICAPAGLPVTWSSSTSGLRPTLRTCSTHSMPCVRTSGCVAGIPMVPASTFSRSAGILWKRRPGLP